MLGKARLGYASGQRRKNASKNVTWDVCPLFEVAYPSSVGCSICSSIDKFSWSRQVLGTSKIARAERVRLPFAS